MPTLSPADKILEVSTACVIATSGSVLSTFLYILFLDKTEHIQRGSESDCMIIFKLLRLFHQCLSG